MILGNRVFRNARTRGWGDGSSSEQELERKQADFIAVQILGLVLSMHFQQTSKNRLAAAVDFAFIYIGTQFRSS